MKYYFTFDAESGNADYYHIIEASTSEKARSIMCERFGNQWSLQYRSHPNLSVDKFNLTELKLRDIRRQIDMPLSELLHGAN